MISLELNINIKIKLCTCVCIYNFIYLFMIPPAPLIPLAPLEGRVLKTKGQKLKFVAAHLTAGGTSPP